jgi:hypothetical protein
MVLCRGREAFDNVILPLSEWSDSRHVAEQGQLTGCTCQICGRLVNVPRMMSLGETCSAGGTAAFRVSIARRTSRTSAAFPTKRGAAGLRCSHVNRPFSQLPGSSSSLEAMTSLAVPAASGSGRGWREGGTAEVNEEDDVCVNLETDELGDAAVARSRLTKENGPLATGKPSSWEKS